jgi:sulfoxide reductase heme-binding subunit YedZ
MVLSRAAAAPARLTDRRIIIAKVLVHAAALAPVVLLGARMWEVWRTGSNALGADPVATVEHTLGLWALRLLLVTLAITPLRQFGHWPLLLRFRRMLGLYAFAYVCLHITAWLVLDLGGYWQQIFADVVKRPYITVGALAWLLLLPLAVTSTRGWMRRLGRRWGQLHKLVYATAVLAVLHFWWQVKADIREPMLYAAILAVLLGWRLWWRWRSRARSPRGEFRRV